MMMSHQETSRPLLTPGEVMQLAPAEELVLVSGRPPLKAQKLRYYADRNFTQRVLPAAERVESGCAVPAVPSEGSDRDSHWAETGDMDGRDPALQPELPLVPERETDLEVGEVEDEAVGPDERKPLDLARRTAAMDRGDQDLLPDF